MSRRLASSRSTYSRIASSKRAGSELDQPRIALRLDISLRRAVQQHAQRALCRERAVEVFHDEVPIDATRNFTNEKIDKFDDRLVVQPRLLASLDMLDKQLEELLLGFDDFQGHVRLLVSDCCASSRSSY